MLTFTSFVNETVMAKIIRAAKVAKQTGINQYVTNRKGNVFIRVGYDRNGKIQLFAGNKEYTKDVFKAVQRMKKIRGL